MRKQYIKDDTIYIFTVEEIADKYYSNKTHSNVINCGRIW
jgi:hypothetical protein